MSICNTVIHCNKFFTNVWLKLRSSHSEKKICLPLKSNIIFLCLSFRSPQELQVPLNDGSSYINSSLNQLISATNLWVQSIQFQLMVPNF